MATLDDLLYQVNAFNKGFKKTASVNSDRGLANFFSTMGKVAEDTENDDEDENENENEDEEESEKEGSCCKKKASRRRYKKTAGKLSPKQAVAYFRKIAILDNPDTQGTAAFSTVGPHEGDGYATEQARETDQYIDFDSVEEQAEENPQKADDSENFDPIEGEAPNSDALVNSIKDGSLHLYTREESEALQKFASLGYRAFVDEQSTKLAEAEINRRVYQKQADYNLDKIAEQRLANYNYQNSVNKAYQKLAYLRQTDPNAFYQLKLAAYNGLI